jgi:DNA-binding MarR family transcriptional regulator
LQELKQIERLLLRVSWLEQRRFAQDLAQFGLTLPQFVALRAVRHGKHPTMTSLANETLQRCATMTGIVDRLVKMGLVVRQRDPEDRRRVLVELTAPGQELMQKVRQMREKRLGETLAQLPPGDASELLRLLKLYLLTFRAQYEEGEDIL